MQYAFYICFFSPKFEFMLVKILLISDLIYVLNFWWQHIFLATSYAATYVG